MQDALRLLRSGRVGAATDAIRQKLRQLSGLEIPQNRRDESFEPANPVGVVEGLHAPIQIPEVGGNFTSASYRSSAGNRSYKVFLPAGEPTSPLPLVVMLHGCTQTPDDFALGTGMNVLAADQQCVVVYPEQTSSANGLKCWNWFKSSDQQRGHGEPAIIAGITREVVNKYGLDTNRVYVAGLSAGGAMAVVMGRTYPDLYAAVGVHSGIPYAVAQDAPSAFAAMKGTSTPARNSSATIVQLIPTIVLHGDGDKTVHPSNGEKLAEQFGLGGELANAELETERGERGRAYTRTLLRSDSGKVIVEYWLVHGAGHAWFGGNPQGSHTDPKGPDASKEILRFFFEHDLKA